LGIAHTGTQPGSLMVNSPRLHLGLKARKRERVRCSSLID